MKKVLILLALTISMLPLRGYCQKDSDDTRQLQTILDNGDAILKPNRVYNVTGLLVTHNIDLNGSTIHMTAASGQTLTVNAANVKISNGTISGEYDLKQPGKYDGTSGILLTKDAPILSKLHVTNFSAQGIVCGPPLNNPVIVNCFIEKFGIMGFFFDSESKPTTGGRFCNNIIDNSAMPPLIVKEGGAMIRGSTDNGTKTSNWTICNNTFKMPYMPYYWNGEGMEIRHINNSIVSGNNFFGGSIGVSVVAGKNITIANNRTFNQKLEGIEFADCIDCVSKNNSIYGSHTDGILIDGARGSNGIQIIGDTIKNTNEACIHTYFNTKNVTITGCILVSKNKGINMQNSSFITITNNKFYGNGITQSAIVLDTCPGNITITGGSMDNFTTSPIIIYSSTPGQVTDNVKMSGVKVTNTHFGITNYLSKGAATGKNISMDE